MTEDDAAPVAIDDAPAAAVVEPPVPVTVEPAEETAVIDVIDVSIVVSGCRYRSWVVVIHVK